jgi:hypothetical protein
LCRSPLKIPGKIGVGNDADPPPNIPYVKEKLTDWLRDRAYGLIYSEDAVEAFHRRDYHAIEDIISKAARIHSFDQGEPFGFVGVEEFLAEETEQDWLIENILLRDQPFAIGGKDKCLKTATVVDMAVSLATGTPFLDKFPCKQSRVAFFNGESNKSTIKRRIRAVQTAKGVVASSKWLLVSNARPQLSNPQDLAKVKKVIERHKTEVLIIDPVYLTLLGGDETGASPSSQFDMGMKLANIQNVVGTATLVLVHHYKKSTPEGKLGLDEFNYTGISSFVRQSLHIGRRAPFTSTRTNQMCLMNHGEGIGGYYHLNIDEGDRLEQWQVMGLEPANLATRREARVKAYENVGRLFDYLRKNGPTSKNKLRKALGLNPENVERMIEAAGERVRPINCPDGWTRYSLNDENEDEPGEEGDEPGEEGDEE